MAPDAGEALFLVGANDPWTAFPPVCRCCVALPPVGAPCVRLPCAWPPCAVGVLACGGICGGVCDGEEARGGWLVAREVPGVFVVDGTVVGAGVVVVGLLEGTVVVVGAGVV
ncbi:MAG: hypothetical protein J2O47_07685, partial [Acidimicrobiaceae bacterium]|nr:hypothetical protein [Acidimicrobiaceae bacterium]